jgi:maltooligosyltrehalose trehalohydrolase
MLVGLRSNQPTADESFKEWKLDLGANPFSKRTRFRVWAPKSMDVSVAIIDTKGESQYRMDKEEKDYFSKDIDVGEETRYYFVLDGNIKRADPASKFQPEGVFGPSEVVDSHFEWTDNDWKGLTQDDLILYEIHVGTFTQKGDFLSLIPYIDYLADELGITGLEIMPVGQFSGGRNWGYDGVFMYAPQSTYGGPRPLKQLIDACHRKKIAVIMDVVYNHVGPEGNVLEDYGPYFSYKYKTPWGPSINYDDYGCDNVRKYIVSNALYWITEYHADGLRLDAVHGIFDFSPKHILEEISDAVHAKASALGRMVSVIAESDLNDTKIIRAKNDCGYGLDAQWSDDFHHSIHAFTTHETFGYYKDFGSIDDIAKSLASGFVYDGRYSNYRERTHGQTSSDLPGRKFVICTQNHDQVGNRADGARLSRLISTAALKAVSGILLSSANIPLLFMGEEYSESTPFYYFTSHSDPKLVEAVREGRKREFQSAGVTGEYPDPQDIATFEKSKLHINLRTEGYNAEVFSHYRKLIELRKAHPALRSLDKEGIDVASLGDYGALAIRRHARGIEELLIICELGGRETTLTKPIDRGHWKKIYDASSLPRASPKEIVPGATMIFPPFAFAVYSLEALES